MTNNDRHELLRLLVFSREDLSAEELADIEQALANSEQLRAERQSLEELKVGLEGHRLEESGTELTEFYERRLRPWLPTESRAQPEWRYAWLKMAAAALIAFTAGVFLPRPVQGPSRVAKTEEPSEDALTRAYERSNEAESGLARALMALSELDRD